MVVDVRFLLGMYKDFLGKRRCRRRYGSRKWVPCSKASPMEARGGMQVTYLLSKIKGACAMEVGLEKSLQRRSSKEGVSTKMTAW